jgi:hypothetical protein
MKIRKLNELDKDIPAFDIWPLCISILLELLN